MIERDDFEAVSNTDPRSPERSNSGVYQDLARIETLKAKAHQSPSGTPVGQVAWRQYHHALQAAYERGNLVPSAPVALEPTTQEAARVYVPGAWYCAKCDFELTKSNLNMGDGTITADDTAGDSCPNCLSPLWRVSWEQRARQAFKLLDEREAELEAQHTENKRLETIINTPETDDFIKGVSIEAEHQRQRYPVEHDASKSGWEWFWVVGFLGQKAATAFEAGDIEKASHHCISTAALMLNMHRHVQKITR